MWFDVLQFDSIWCFSDIVNMVVVNNVFFYMMDVMGLLGCLSFGVEYQVNFMLVNIDLIVVQNMQVSIQFFVDEMGGQFIVNMNNFDDGFDCFGSDFVNYYLLGFLFGYVGLGC